VSARFIAVEATTTDLSDGRIEKTKSNDVSWPDNNLFLIGLPGIVLTTGTFVLIPSPRLSIRHSTTVIGIAECTARYRTTSER
jgi:hypothetical protein